MVNFLKVVAASRLPWAGDVVVPLADADPFVFSLLKSCCFVQEKNSNAITIKIRFLIVQLVFDKIIDVYWLCNSNRGIPGRHFIGKSGAASSLTSHTNEPGLFNTFVNIHSIPFLNITAYAIREKCNLVGTTQKV